MTTEQELIAAIQQAEEDRLKTKERIRKLQKDLVDSESDLIESNIRKDRLKEELRVHRSVTPRTVLSEREKEIEAFRAKYPELCQKNEEI